jgi:hypothetical protein
MNWSQSEENGLYFCNEKQPHYQATQAIKATISEASKGCTGEIFNYPIASIEPGYEPFNYKDCLYEPKEIVENPQMKKNPNKYSFVILYFGIEDASRWLLGVFEALSSMCQIKGMQCFEVIAVKDRIHIQFCVDKKNALTVENALKARFVNTEVQVSAHDYLQECIKASMGQELTLESYYPHYPFYRNLIAPISKQQVSQLHVLLQAVSGLEENEVFYYRVSIESASAAWDKNAVSLHNYETKILGFYSEANLISDWQFSPFSESKRAIAEKLHPEKTPFYFIQPMVVLFGKKDKFNALKSFLSGYRFGDQAYLAKTEKDFINKLGEVNTIKMIAERNLHMQGHFVNRFEASLFLPFPCLSCHQMPESKLLSSIGRPIPKAFQESGILLGIRDNAGVRSELRISKSLLQHSMAIIGAMGYGKSNLLLNTISQITESTKPKYAMVLFYFQDFEFIANFISRIPENRLQDVVLAMPMLDGKVLKRNIVDFRNVKSIAEKAAGLTYAVEAGSASFGIDVKYVMKNLIQILLYSDNVSLRSLFEVIQAGSEEGKRLRRAAYYKTFNPLLKQYIRTLDERGEDEKKIFNKFQQFFDHEETTMLANYSGESVLDYSDIIENKKILIWYLGGLGEAGSAFASIEVANIHHHFHSYEREFPRKYRPTIIAIDEVQRIRAHGIADSVREDRKFGLSYIFSTQTTRGLDPYLLEAIELIPNLVYFQCTEDDARYFASRAGGAISSKQIAAFDKYEMVARIVSAKNVFSCKTEKFQEGCLAKIDFVKKNSLEKYYMEIVRQNQAEYQNQKQNILDNLPEEIKNISKRKPQNKRS